MSTVLFLIIVLIVILSGPVMCSALFNWRVEFVMPIQFGLMVSILYIFVLSDRLLWGVNCLVIIVVAAYIISVLGLLVKRNHSSFIRNIVTPGFCSFLLLFVLNSIADYDMLAVGWDEFSHWMISVKEMTYYNDLISNPAAHGVFQSYPPGITLFLYFFQKLYLFVDNECVFCEWSMFFVYKLFGMSMLLPLLSKEEFSKPYKCIFHAALLFFIPLFYYNNCLFSLYVDPLIGIISGACLTIIMCSKDCIKQIVIVSMMCIMLVLIKDVGFFFAMLISILYCASCFIALKKSLIENDNRNAKCYIIPFLPIVLTGFVKGSWKYELVHSGARIVFGDRIQIFRFIKLLFHCSNDLYRQDVVDSYRNAFFEQGVAVDFIDITISYVVLFLIIAVGVVLLWKLIDKRVPTRESSLPVKLGLIMICIMLVLYITGLGALYISSFNDYEASILASYSRYMNIVFLTVSIPLVSGIVCYFPSTPYINKIRVLVLVCVVSLCPIATLFRYYSREQVMTSHLVRSDYDPLSDLIRENCISSDGDDVRVFFISEGDGGYDYWVTRYVVRPYVVLGDDLSFIKAEWSLGEPQFDGDVWSDSLILDDESWMSVLNNGDYSYIALYRVNDYFKDHYSDVFEDPNSINDNALYRRNENTGLYELISY